ncbi:class I SAM-dependent methyltransferase [Ornithinimicrobium sediminis]|uniref:class I SAM-dependent methyltransferase n=1 Tax=Ornithinimicrobium sediminis TaxID=2904603 RepID=UPI001E52DD0A|nr:class I SAM-dependent methyltransferase [Ornithinimicrobium sediminis]MCE0485781.1 class I SAM-dependent methyltransferase [Ornithinimicrobium sediminis]
MSGEVVPSPNIWEHADVYELENSGVDPGGAVWAAMRQVAGWSGRRVLDLGCGSGYHLPFFAQEATEVVGVEPHPPLVARARDRVADLPRARVLQGTAQAVPLEDASVDIVHARWAYFFGAGCEPGLAEVERVLAPGGTAFVVDNDATRSTFGAWFRRAWPHYDPAAVERFWRRQGYAVSRVDMRWRFASRTDFEAVVRIEFTETMADCILGEHPGTGVDYAVNLWHRTF